jgi:hypothetical protein
MSDSEKGNIRKKKMAQRPPPPDWFEPSERDLRSMTAYTKSLWRDKKEKEAAIVAQLIASARDSVPRVKVDSLSPWLRGVGDLGQTDCEALEALAALHAQKQLLLGWKRPPSSAMQDIDGHLLTLCRPYNRKPFQKEKEHPI